MEMEITSVIAKFEEYIFFLDIFFDYIYFNMIVSNVLQ